MANTPGGSFIPKRSTGKVTQTRSGRRIYIFSYIAYVFFFGTIFSVVGIFFLNKQAENQLSGYVVQVDEIQKSINRGQLESIREFNNRLHFAKQILDTHAAPSVLFDVLQSTIIDNIQISSFDYSREEGVGVELTLGGITDTFDALIFQRDVIKSNDLLASADIIEVGYGPPDLLAIEGANRSGENSGELGTGEASVTFTFMDDAILKSIGYTPRQNLQRGSQSQPSAQDVEDIQTADVVEATETSESDNQSEVSSE